MRAAFFILCGLILYAYAGYPALIWIGSRLFPRRHAVDPAHEPTVTILVAAYNEQSVIGDKLENLLALEYPSGKMQIIVASESNDATDQVVRGYAQTDPVRVTLIPSDVRRGKVANLHRAIPAATGEILVFTDANAMLRPDALRKLVRHFADPRVGSVSGRLVYETSGATASAVGESAYWDFEMMVKKASSRLGSLPGANGSLFALRRSLYRPISGTRGDDFELPIRVILAGHYSILEPDEISIEPAAHEFLHEYRRKVRIVHWMLTSALILLREALRSGRWLIAFQLLSHKINRWLVSFWLLALLPLSLALAGEAPVYTLAAAAQVLVYSGALAGMAAGRAGWRIPKLLSLPLYFVVVNVASLVAIVSLVTGREVQWHKRPDRAS